MMLDTQRSPRTEVELIDSAAIVADLKTLAKAHAGRERELRTAVALRLKSALTQARSRAEQLLLKDRHGRRCAERLCQLQDAIIRILFEFIGSEIYPPQAPSEAEHMAVVATGGYGRGLLAPSSDIDLLFLLPYKQTPWGERVAEYMLYVPWDLGSKVGAATRTIDQCIKLGTADITIRTSLLDSRLVHGDAQLYARFEQRFRTEVVEGTARGFIDAKMVERDARHKGAGESRYKVEPNIKDRK